MICIRSTGPIAVICLLLSMLPSLGVAEETPRQQETPQTPKNEEAPKTESTTGTEEPKPTVLPEMEVTAPQKEYTVPNASTATKTDTPIMETPASVQVVPKAVLDDQQAVNLDDVYKNVSGMQPDYGFGNWDAAYIRGFSTMEANQNAVTYRDGVRSFGRGGGLEEMSNVEQVEVLKGPASVLYGRIEPGGLINVITKQPESDPYYSLQQQAGSYDFYRTTVDATGPVTQDKTLLYRIDGAYQNSDSFRDVLFSDYRFIAPSLAWRPNAKLEFNLNFEDRYAHGPGDFGIPALVPGVSKSLWVGDKTDNAWLKKNRENFDWSYKFDNDWKLRNGFSFFNGNTRYDSLYDIGGTFHGSSLNPVTGDLRLAPWVGNNDVNAQSAFLEFTRHFESLGAMHDVLVGGDDLSSSTKLKYYTNNFSPIATFNIFNPVYGFVNYNALEALPPDFLESWDERWEGAYAQDQITMEGNLHLLLGGRYDWTETSIAGTYVSPTLPHTTYRGFKPRAGLLYQTAKWLSVYGSYTESVGALNPGVSSSGTTFRPEQAKQYEAGIKTDFFDGLLNSTLAVYQITKTNVITPDPAQPLKFDVASGEVRSKGVELDMSGRVTDQLSLMANYAYTVAVVTRDDNGFQGLTPPNLAKNTGNLWAKYAATDRLSIGSGVYLSGSRYGDSFNTFKLPGYARWDAMMAYHFKYRGSRMTAQLNVDNILDKSYLLNTVHIDTTPYSNIIPGTPRTVLGSIKIEF